jgi:hypothetical protein
VFISVHLWLNAFFRFMEGAAVSGNLLVASFAIRFVLHVKGALAVVANSAKLALVEFVHVHFIGLLGHLEGMIMTSAALRPPDVNVILVAEEDRLHSFGFEQPVASTGRSNRDARAKEHNSKNQKNSFH